MSRRLNQPPPGPSGLPGVGSLLSVRRSNRLDFLASVAADHGTTASYEVFGRRSILLTDPRTVRGVLRNESGLYTMARADQLAALELVAPPAVTWIRSGRSTRPTESVRALRELTDLVEADCDRATASWTASSTVDLVEASGVLVAELVRTAILGRSPHLEEAVPLSEALTFALSDGREPPRANRTRRSAWRRCVHELRTAALAGSTATESRRRHQRDGFTTLLMSSYSPLSSAFVWIMVVLAERPDLRQRIVDVSAGMETSEASRAPLVTGFVREVLRLYSPAYALVRRPSTDDLIEGYTIPGGTKTILSPYLLGRDPRLWPRAAELVPEREVNRDAYIPFGLGAARCPGRSFATLLLRLTTVVLARTVTIEPAWPPGANRPTAKWALLPAGPLPARVSATEGPARRPRRFGH